jgi:hypothetical protein
MSLLPFSPTHRSTNLHNTSRFQHFTGTAILQHSHTQLENLQLQLPFFIASVTGFCAMLRPEAPIHVPAFARASTSFSTTSSTTPAERPSVHLRGTRHHIQSHNGHRGGLLAFYGAYGSNRSCVRNLEAVEFLELYLVLEVTIS